MKISLILISLAAVTLVRADQPPNIILILADDLGYGDIGVYGAKLINTPNIDSLATEGIRLTQFYTSGNVCTPSRAGLLTGRYPIRTGLADRTLSVGDVRGLSQQEVTLADQLDELGYVSALVGKWHLGDQPEYHPLKQGFDEFFGVLYSNDEPEQALLRNNELVENPINPRMLATEFTQESINFIERNRSRPFFLFLSTTSPHKPLLPSAAFSGKSSAGAYGDVVEELDWGVGEIMATLNRLGLADNTLVIFTSDNGPFPEGSTGDLRGGKGTAWDGGYRVPLIARWPGFIKPGTESSMMSMNIDLMPTLLVIAGGNDAVPVGLDGKNISAGLHGENQSPHEVLYFFNNERIAALRTERWRLVLSDYPPWRDAQPIRFENQPDLQTLLFDMSVEPTQQYDLSHKYPDQKHQLELYLQAGREGLESLSEQPDSTQFGDTYKN